MIDDAKQLLSLGASIREAIEGADAVKTKIHTRLNDYDGVLQMLLQSELADVKNELLKLRGLYEGIEALYVKHTAGDQDPRWFKVAKKVSRGTQQKSIEEDLDAIDKEARQLFGIIATKCSIDTGRTIKQMLELQRRRNTVGTQVSIVGVFGALLIVFSAVIWAQRNAFSTMIRGVLPPPWLQRTGVPAGALELPRSYVERPGVQEAVNALINNPDAALAPYTIVGMGGGGKTILASAVVRDTGVRKHFRGGIHWLRVGRGGENRLLQLLQGLGREIGAASTDTPHGVPHVFDSLEQVKQQLAMAASTGAAPRLVVLDDVWEREVVDALLGLRLKVLVTTRDRSVVGVPGGWLELGDMAENEALALLLKTSRVAGQPGGEVRTQMMKVVDRCGRLPLLLAIAGSMSVVEGRGLTTGAWEELIKLFENAATTMWGSAGELTSLDEVLGASFSALSAKKRKEFLKMAVLAPGVVAPIEMLQNLWETEDKEGAREEADGLTSKSLLQDVGGGGYCVHDLVLDFMRIRIKADPVMLGEATARQAHHLSRLDVVKSYGNPENGTGDQGLLVLGSLWRSVEKLSGDRALQAASYRASLGELESCEATADVALSYSLVGFLYYLQGKYSEAETLYEHSQVIQEKVLGPEHPDVATSLSNRAELLRKDGTYANACRLCALISERTLGPDPPDLATGLNKRVLTNQEKLDKANLLYLRAIEIGEKALGPDHLDLATWLNNRAGLLERQGNRDEAGQLYEHSLAIREKALGPDHPLVAVSLNNLAMFLVGKGKLTEAGSLYERVIEIEEKVLGPEHPSLGATLEGRAMLLEFQGKHKEAIPFLERARLISRKSTGDHDP